MATPPQQQPQGPGSNKNGSEGPTPKPPQAGSSSSAAKAGSPFHSISDDSRGGGGGGGGGNGKGPSPMGSGAGELPPMPPRRNSRAPTPYTESRAAAIFTSNVGAAAVDEEGGGGGSTGLRRRRGGGANSTAGGEGSTRSVSPERDSSRLGKGGGDGTSTPNNTPSGGPPASRSSPAASLLGSLGRGVLGVSRIALGAAATSIGPPFAWAEFMFAWVADVTPPRLKRLARIFWDAGAHITKLAYTPAGAELGFAARNVVDGLVETIAAPKGRAVVLETGMTFVKLAEAVDTPEMHAAITQAFKLGQRGLDMLATDQAKDLLANGADLLSRLARLANAPETTLAVAEFVTVVCHALAQENAAYSRERVAQLSPFEAGGGEGSESEGEGLGGEESEEEPLLKKKAGGGAAGLGSGVRIVREDSATGERLEWDEDLVLGRKRPGAGAADALGESKTSTEGSTPRGTGEGEEEELDVSMAEGPSGRPGEGGGAEGEPELLPIQEGAMESSVSGLFAGSAAGGSVGEHARWEREDKALLVRRLVETVLEEKRRAAAAGGVYTPAGAYKSERQRAAHCALSFVFFISYTVFALVGLRATLAGLVAYGSGTGASGSGAGAGK